MQGHLKNITPKQFKSFLIFKGLKHIRTTGGHEIWSRNDLRRPAVIQTHEDPIPESIVKNNLRTINSSKEELLNYLLKN